NPSGRAHAEAAAVALGGHLITVNEAAEQGFLQSAFGSTWPPNKWIGLQATTPSGIPNVWVGEDSAYRNWAPGSPVAGQGQFVYAGRAGGWVQRPNDSTSLLMGGVVEVPPPPCRCDWNRDGMRTSSDFFEFLTGFFEANSDYNCSGDTTS